MDLPDLTSIDIELISKIIFGLISAFGAGTLAIYNIHQSKKSESELLEKFDKALAGSNKHLITELFRLIHGVYMDYPDVRKLIKRDDSTRILYALKKTPGYVTYKNGQFGYTMLGRYRWFRALDIATNLFNIVFVALGTIIAIAFFAFGGGMTSVLGFIGLLGGGFYLSILIRDRDYQKTISALISSQ
ncbi:MAG: hypothetical protein B0W54_06880 [Cellvibrio sp. 79]|nr:MAG: hypothetical protein B0W54_06880 [Cellvibrio sp. 79]